MKTAPDFTLTDQNGKVFHLYENLSQPVILVFYPKDESPVCTKQLCNYNDNYKKFADADIQIVGINFEGENSHKQFANKFSLQFPLLSDKDREVSKAYGALNFAGLNRRKIVIISIEKKIVYEDLTFPAFYQKSVKLLEVIKTNKYLKLT